MGMGLCGRVTHLLSKKKRMQLYKESEQDKSDRAKGIHGLSEEWDTFPRLMKLFFKAYAGWYFIESVKPVHTKSKRKNDSSIVTTHRFKFVANIDEVFLRCFAPLIY
jgi:hypothetical protein